MIKVPYTTLNLRKWRRENGLDTEAIEAYVKALTFRDALFTSIVGGACYWFGYVVGRT